MDLLPLNKINPTGQLICSYNPLKCKKYSENYKYYPKLALFRIYKKKFYIYKLMIEFSIPKLLFGNNFEEVMEEDYSNIIDTLHERLSELGVRVNKSDLMIANVSKVHFSKNLNITDFANCATLLDAISKVNIRSNIDVGRTDYINNGRIVRFHADSYEFVFYDKMKDLQAAYNISEKRPTEDNSLMQIPMLEKYKNQEIFRIEIRINKMQKFYDILKKHKIPHVENTLPYLLNRDIAMKICLIYWDIITEKLKTVVFEDKHLHNIVGYLLSKKKWHKDKILLALWEIHLQNQYGENFLKDLVSSKRSKMINNIIVTNSPDRSYILQVAKMIRAKILKFEPIRENWKSIYKEKFDVNKIKLFD